MHHLEGEALIERLVFVCVTGTTAIQRGRARLYPAVEEYVQELGTRYSEVSWHKVKENLSLKYRTQMPQTRKQAFDGRTD